MRPPVIAAIAVVLLAAGGAALFLMSSPEPAPVPATAPAAPREAAPPPPAAPAPTAAVPEVRRSAPQPAPEVAPAPVVEVAPTTATIRVEADVEGATVFLDRVSVGTAPVAIPNVAPGPHDLSVSATGYDRHSETITVEPGTRTVSVSFKEIKLAVNVAAVHKHGIGSCKGRLFGTPEGVRYEAADGKDNVTVAFADIAAFDLDYLNKNVRLRTKQGRTFNFTESEGNLDQLAYFHRDVDKVRKRVLAQ